MKRSNLERLAERLAEATDWLSAGELAVSLNTTTRTVRNYITELNKTEGGAPLIISGPKGYRWNTEQAQKRELYRISRTLPETPRERAYYLIRKLLFGKDTDLLQLSAALMVSDRTVQLDLEQLRSTLRGYGLSVRQQRDVMSLSGPETGMRRLAFDCIVQTCNTRLLSLKMLEQVFPELCVEQIDAQLNALLPSFGLTLNAYSRYDLLLLILIQITRISAERLIGLALPIRVPEHAPEYRCAAALAKWLEERLSVHYTAVEICYLTVLLVSKADSNAPLDTQTDEAFAELPEHVRRAFEIIRRRIGADLGAEEPPPALVQHLYRMIVRVRMGISVYDPISDVLKTHSPYLYDCAAWMMTQFVQAYHIAPGGGEVAFLALRLHLLLNADLEAVLPIRCTLICPEFGGIADEVSSKLLEKFSPRLRLEPVIRSLDLETLPPSELCLSVLPLESKRKAVLISPFLTEQDCELVRKELLRVDRSRTRDYLSSYLSCYSGPQFFEIAEGFANREDVLGHICSALSREDVVGPAFYDTVMQRELAVSTAVFHQAALPHACISGVRKNTIYLLKSKTPIPWGEDRVRLVILMALQRALLADFKYIYSLFLRLLSQPKNLAAFLEAESFQSLLDAVSHMNAE